MPLWVTEPTRRIPIAANDDQQAGNQEVGDLHPSQVAETHQAELVTGDVEPGRMRTPIRLTTT
jgi:hypothetical protein